MAFTSVIRRGSTSIFPAAIWSVTSRRAFSTVSNRRSVEVGTQFLPAFRFSTAASEKLPSDDDHDVTFVRVLESVITRPMPPDEDIPDGFPFEIEGKVILKRKYQNEIITIRNKIPWQLRDGRINRKGNAQESDVTPSLELFVDIRKEDNGDLRLSFTVFCWSDKIVIDNVVMYPRGDSDYPEQHNFNDLDEDVQKGLYKYLEIRGVKLSMTNFLEEYVANKEKKERLLWLKKLKGFIEL